MEGEGCKKDAEAAFKVYKFTADRNYKYGCLKVGYCCLNGIGTTIDFKCAREYLQKAIDLGSQYAVELMDELKVKQSEYAENNKVYNAILENIALTKDTQASILGLDETTNKRMLDIKADTKKIYEGVNDIQEKLQDIILFIKSDLNRYICDERRLLVSELKEEPVSSNAESKICAKLDGITKYISNRMTSFEDVRKEEEERLRNLFGEVWNKLLDSSKAALISAAVLWKCCAKLDDNSFDYSGICISATSALEGEIRKIFCDNFQSYLLKKYEKPDFATWPEEVLSYNKKDYDYAKKKGKNPVLKPLANHYFTLGTLTFLFNLRDNQNTIKFNDKAVFKRQILEGYLEVIVSDEILDKHKDKICNMLVGTGKGSRSFIDRCDYIRDNYRNKAAHADIMTKKEAQDCFAQIYGKKESENYLKGINSIIIMLYSYLK